MHLNIPSSVARREWAHVLNRVGYGGERILVVRHFKRPVALVSVDDLELLEELEDRLDLAEAKSAMSSQGTRSWYETKSAVGF